MVSTGETIVIGMTVFQLLSLWKLWPGATLSNFLNLTASKRVIEKTTFGTLGSPFNAAFFRPFQFTTSATNNGSFTLFDCTTAYRTFI